MDKLTSGIQSGWDTITAISSSGKRLWHLISVLTFLPIVQQANNLTNSTWYLKYIYIYNSIRYKT